MFPLRSLIVISTLYFSLLAQKTTFPPIVIPGDQNLKAFYFTDEAIWTHNRTTKGPPLRCQVDLVKWFNTSDIFFTRMFLTKPFSIRNKTVQKLRGEIVDYWVPPGGTIMMVGYADQERFTPLQSEQILFRDAETGICAVFLVNPMSPYSTIRSPVCELRVRGNKTISPSPICTYQYKRICSPHPHDPAAFKPYCRNILRS